MALRTGLGLSIAFLAAGACLAASGLSAIMAVGKNGGGLVVANSSNASTRLGGAVVVEGYDGHGWKPLVTEMNLVRSCPANGVVMGPAPPVTLAPGEKFSPPAWRGWSCSGQCEAHCHSNVYWGAGPFRFRLTRTGGGDVVSNAFRMPAQSPR